jgi:adhesin/invasin
MTRLHLRSTLLLAALALAAGSGAARAQAAGPAVPPQGLYGDANGDGRVTALDAVAVLAHVVGRPTPAGYTLLPNGDADGDGRVTAVDALVIAAWAVGRDMSRFRVGQPVTAAVQPPAEGPSLATAPPGSVLTVQQGNAQSGWTGDSLRATLQVLLKTSGGTPVSAVTVDWSVTGGGGSLRSAISVTNASGVAANRLLPLSSGPQTVRASVTGAGFVDFTATAFNPANSTIVIHAGNLQTGTVNDTLPAQPSVEVKDSLGATIKGVSVIWTVLSGGGSVPLPRTTTSVTGLAATRWTAGPTVGTQTLKAEIPGGPSVTFSADVLSTLGTITKLADFAYGIAGDTIGSGGWVEVRNSLGNPITTAFVDWTPQDGSAVTAVRTHTNVSGRAITKWKLGPTAGPQHLRAGVDSIGTVTISAIAVAASDVVLIKRADNQRATGGTALTLYLDVRDPTSHIMSTWVAYTPLTGGSPTPAGRVLSSTSGGRATLSWVLGAARGWQTFRASVGGGAKQTVFNALSTMLASDSLRVVGGSTQAVAGHELAQPLRVRVADASGNVVPGYPVAFKVSAGGGTVDGGAGPGISATVNTDALGVALLPHWMLGAVPDSNAVRVTAGALTLVYSARGVAAGEVTGLAQQPGLDGQSGGTSAPIGSPPAVIATDADGNPVAGAVVTFAVTGGGGTVTGASAVTGADGVATVGSWTLGPAAGANTLSATLGALPPVTFTATGVAGITGIVIQP